jgi:hypothetical protein
MHGLSHVIDEENSANNLGLKFSVPVIRLDEMEPLRTPLKPVTAIKIDIENFEYRALKGAEKLITMHRPVIYCELWENDNRKKCIGFLNKLNYSAFILNRKELVPVKEAAVDKHNFFFLPD